MFPKSLRAISESVIGAVGPHRWPSPTPRLWILMYHRILPSDDRRKQLEEPGMVVTPRTFENHIRWIRERFELVRLEQWLDAAREDEELPQRAVAITFDDGWRDNFEYALPVLADAGASATVFLVTDLVGTARTFWPNRLVRLVTGKALLGSRSDDAEWLRRHLPLFDEWNGERIARLIAAAKRFDEEEVLGRLDRLEHDLGVCDTERSIVSWSEVATMVGSGCFDVGSHGRTHLRLVSGIDSETLCREIVESKKVLEEALQRSISLFCYPNGDATLEAETMVREHYRAAVTTRSGLNTKWAEHHRLKRIALHEDVANSKSALLSRLCGV